MNTHSFLSASGSPRWMNCTRAPKYESQFPDTKSTVFADEGVFAHAVAEQAIGAYLGIKKPPLPQELMHFDTPELRESVNVYVKFVIELIQESRRKDPTCLVLLEQKVDFAKWVPEGYGTCDLVIIAKGVVKVVDLKYGKGLKIFVKRYSQTRLYALGAVVMFDHIYDINRVEMVIVQPRLNHIDCEELSKNELLVWADTEVAPKAALAFAGQGSFKAGDHCRWCKGKYVCAERAQSNLEAAKFDFAEPDTLDDETIAHLLEKAARLHAWVKDVESYALSQALKGHKFPGYKVVAGRTTRKFEDTYAVIDELSKAGVDSEIIFAPRELNTLTALEATVGKKKFAQILGDLIVQSPGKPTLVPLEDKRPEFSIEASAASDFSKLI